MIPAKTTLADAFAAIDQHGRPRVIASLNGQEVKVVKLLGPFVWHAHPDADELLWVHCGTLEIQFRDGNVHLGPGEMVVVPRGVEHKPVADEEVELLPFEPAGVINTGDAPCSNLTVA